MLFSFILAFWSVSYIALQSQFRKQFKSEEIFLSNFKSLCRGEINPSCNIFHLSPIICQDDIKSCGEL